MSTPDKVKKRKAKTNPMAWVHLGMLAIIVIAFNYIGCQEYLRRDLTEDERYTVSERTQNVLTSKRIQEHEAPVRIIFAFKRSAQNYARMRSLLEEYNRLSKGKVVVEFLDPLRQPNRAMEIEQIYGIKFNQDLCVVDARKNADLAMRTFEGTQGEQQHVRFRPGASFIRYDTLADGSKRAVALMMDEVLCNAITEAVEGNMRQMYVVEGKGGVSRDDMEMLDVMEEISTSLNIKLNWIDIANIEKLPADAEGLLIIGPQVDFTENEMKVLRDIWSRDGRNALFIALDPHQNKLPQLYRFLREQGIRPNADRVLLRDRKRAYYNISAVFPRNNLECTRSFWNNTTNLEGQSMSLSLEHADENMATVRRLTSFPLLVTTPEYYGETRTGLEPSFDPAEDKEGPLCLAAAVIRGSANDPNNMASMMVLGNTQILSRDNLRENQRDYLRSVFAWMSNRPEYSGRSANHDLMMLIDLNRHSKNALEYLTLIGMPLCALLIALLFWNTRRH